MLKKGFHWVKLEVNPYKIKKPQNLLKLNLKPKRFLQSEKSQSAERIGSVLSEC